MKAPPTMTDYEKIEVQQVSEQLRSSYSSLVQVFTFFGTVNITILGFGFTLKMAGLMLVAAAMIGLLALVNRSIRNYQRIYFTRGIELERKFSTVTTGGLLQRDYERTYLQRGGPLRRNWLPLSIFGVEISLALFARFVLGWTWF